MKSVVYSILFLILSVISSCSKTEKIDEFPLEKPKLVVNCFLTDNQPMEFYLSKSLSSIDNAPIKKVTNAEISIYEDNKLIEVLNLESNNPLGTNDAYYRSTVFAQIGKSYKISVTAPKLNTVSSETYIVSPMSSVTGKVGIIDTTIYKIPGNFAPNDSTIYSITFTKGNLTLSIPDKAKENNYYKVLLYAQKKYWDGSKWDYSYENISLTNDEIEFENYSNGLFFTDKLYDGKNIPIKLNLGFSYLNTAEPLLKFKVVVSNLSEAKYKYDLSLGQYYQNQNNPFVEPTMVYSNIINGYGIFASESKTELILE